jgi:hypothetical protein
MAHKTSRSTCDREKAAAARLLWRLREGNTSSPPHRVGRRWLLVAAVVLQVAWIAALVAMAMFVRWKK